MVHPQQVEQTVDQQQRHLVVERAGVVGGLAGGHRRADHDVAEQRGARRRVVTVPGSSRGNASTSVGGAVAVEVLPLEVGDGAGVDEGDRDLHGADLLVHEHVGGQPLPPLEIDRFEVDWGLVGVDRRVGLLVPIVGDERRSGRW